MSGNLLAIKCVSCICEGTNLGEVDALPGFLYYQCQNRNCPTDAVGRGKTWLVCTRCEKCHTQFQLDAFARKSSDPVKKQLMDHIRMKHKDINLRDIPQYIPVPPNKRTRRNSVGLSSDDEDSDVGSDSEQSATSVVLVPYSINADDDDADVEEIVLHEKEVRYLEAEFQNFLKLQHHQLGKHYVCAVIQNNNSTATAAQPTCGVLSQEEECRPCYADNSTHYIFQRKESMEFFHTAWGPNRNGLKLLIRKAIYREAWDSVTISDQDATKFFLLVKLVWKLSRPSRQQLAPLLGLFQAQQQASCIPPIQRYNDLRKMVWEGKFAFMNNIPHPQIETYGECIYISVMDSIAHILGSDSHNLDTIEPYDFQMHGVRRTSQSHFCQERYDDKVDMHLVLMIWQDGFQANYSTKTNRLKPWIKTGTLAPRGKSWKSDVMKTTFPIAFGTEAAEKNPVEDAFYREMRQLDKPGGQKFYDGKSRKVILVRVTLAVIRGDQPERRKMCGLVAIQGNVGGGFGVLGNYKAIKKYLPSCDRCLKSLLDDKKIIMNCPKCLNWDVYRKSEMNTFDPPAHYPKTELPPSGKLRFQKITFEQLRAAADRAHEAILKQEWNVLQTKAFLKANALNDKSIAGIMLCAKGSLLKQNAIAMRENDPDHYNLIMERAKQSPHLYEKWVKPVIWNSGMDMDQVICIIMHLLFLGLSKHMMSSVQNWAKTQRKGKAFTAYAKGLLEAVAKLNVPWCKPQPYGEGTAGSWVSEDYLSLAKIMPWFYSMLDEVKGDKEDVDLDTYVVGDLDCWGKETCKLFLQVRNLDITGSSDALKKRAHSYMDRPGGPPKPLVEQPEPRLVRLCIQGLAAMLSRIMTTKTTEDSNQDVDCHVRIFLSYYSRFDTAMTSNEPNKIPSWVSHANFLSLPRVIESMKLFGPLRLTWEGDVGGEGMIQLLKPDLRGMRKGWAQNCMLKLARTMSLSSIDNSAEWQEILTRASSDSSKSIREILGEERIAAKRTDHGYCRYRNMDDLFKAFTDNMPMSGIVTTHGEHGICFKLGRKHEDVFLVISHTQYERRINGLAYHRWSFGESTQTKTIDSTQIARSILFLPQLCSDGFITEPKMNGVYTVVGEDWTNLDSDSNYTFPDVDSWYVTEL